VFGLKIWGSRQLQIRDQPYFWTTKIDGRKWEHKKKSNLLGSIEKTWKRQGIDYFSFMIENYDSLKINSSLRREFLKNFIFGVTFFVAWTIANAWVQETKYPEWYIEKYYKNGNQRKIIVRWKSLNQVHVYAANNFTRYLEDDFKDSSKFYAVNPKSFVTSVKKYPHSYEMMYSIDLISVHENDKHFRIIDMRWSVVDWMESEITAKNINSQKIPQWQRKMREVYWNMQYLIATYNDKNIYHEVILWFGEWR